MASDVGQAWADRDEQELAEAGRGWAGTGMHLHFTAATPPPTSFHIQSPLWMKIYLLPEATDDF